VHTDSLQTSFLDQARRLVAARYALVSVQTHEEARLEKILAKLASDGFSTPVPLYAWSRTNGLAPSPLSPDPGTLSEKDREGSESPTVALDAVMAYARPAVFLFKDLHRFFDDDLVVRKLRDAYEALGSTYKTVFISSSVLNVPAELHKEVAILDLLLPTAEELSALFDEVCKGFPKVKLQLGDARDVLIRGALGLTENEARTAFTKLLLGKRLVGPEVIDLLYAEKQEIVRKEGILEYVPPRVRLEDIGGLDMLKEWLRQRRRFFSKEARDFGLESPKGVLITGISGCGKSLAVKAISAYWGMPMLRLDMNRVYAGVAGSPERSLELALKTAEAVSPCVLWIDEIETAIVGTHGAEGRGLSTRIFSSFLTWMQEKQQVVFVAATANQIDQLPPELMRKGRFDEIFFVDLPNEDEREEIFAVHLALRHKDPEEYDLVALAKATPGYNGAEIEQIVLASLFEAFDERRDVTRTDLYRSIGRMVPLSTTMSERIKEIKRWADTRAVKASR